MEQSNFKYYMKEAEKLLCTMRTLTGAEKTEILDVVEAYHKQREKGKDGISTTSQTMWYANRLSRNALERHGLSMSETYKRKTTKDTNVMSFGDGNHRRIEYTSPYIRTKTFHQQHKVIYQCKDILQEKYFLADTRYENSKTKYCENCGGLIDMSKGYQGCPYCDAPIRIKEIHNKIMSVSRAVSEEVHMKWIIMVVILLLFLLGLVSGYIQMQQEGVLKYGVYAGSIAFIVMQAAFIAVLYGAIFGFILACIILMPTMCSIQSSETRINKVGYEMRREDPNFSSTEIYGTIQAYTKLWFLANNVTDMGHISKVEYNQDDGIVDVDCVGLKKARCWTENGYSYIEGKLLVRYITVHDNRFEKKRTRTFVTLRRRQGVISSLKTEALKCSCCGANIDILKGSCIACGNSLDIEYYDWILYNIRNV